MNCIFLFDTTGVMAKPWAEMGFDCHCFDQQNDGSTEDGIKYWKWDALLEDLPEFDEVAFIACWPPCTHVAVSGARWFKGKGLRKLAESIEMFAVCAEFCDRYDAPWMIENPMSTISTYWRSPDYKFHPCHYSSREPADSYTKETWVWAGGGFVMPPRMMDHDLFIDQGYIHRQPPGPERANIRSATPAGFARAAFEANCHD
jgi:hypothetical protein